MQSGVQFLQTDRGVHRITRYSLPNFGEGQRRLPSESVVLHIDIDAFYAQVEQVDYNLRGIPVIIGAWESDQGAPRGIVATSSYEARQLGIQTGMSHFEARRRCPYLVALRINYEKYRTISCDILQLLQQRFPEVERYSMDEFFARLPACGHANSEHAYRVALTLQRDIETKFSLTTSIGVSTCKTYAKLGSSLRKPTGISILLDPETIRKQVHPLPLQTICGIGASRANQLAKLGLHRIGDAVTRGKGPFQSLFGPHLGQLMWEASVGSEMSPILETEPPPEAYHHIHTLARSTNCSEQLRAEFVRSVFEVCQRMRRRGVRTRRWEIYLRFESPQWEGVTIPLQLKEPSCCDSTILKASWFRLERILIQFQKLGHSFLGIGITALEPETCNQLLLHLDSTPEPDALFHAMDRCNQTTGSPTVSPVLLHQASHERVHFLEI